MVQWPRTVELNAGASEGLSRFLLPLYVYPTHLQGKGGVRGFKLVAFSGLTDRCCQFGAQVEQDFH